MDLKLKRPNVPDGYRVIWPLALLFAVLLLLFPRNAKFSYDYRKGSQWHHENLVAQFDFPILKTEEQLREERSRTNTSTVPYYRFRQDVVDNMVKGASEADLGGYPSLLPVVLASLEGIYETGVVPDEGVKLDKGEKDVSGAVMYVQKDKRAVKKPVTEVFLESEAKAKLLADVTARSRSHVNVDSLLRNAGIYDFIAPNLEYDAKTTELVKSESGQQVSTTQGFVSAGELIVSSGEMVTSEVAQMLDSYKAEYENSMGYAGPRVLFWIGNALIALVIVLLFFLTVYFVAKNLLGEYNRYLYLVFIFFISTALTLLMNRFAPRFMYLVPFTLIALYLEAFFKNKVIMPVCFVSFLPMLIFANNGIVLYVMFCVASMVSVFMFKYFNRGWKQFINAGIVFVSLVVTYFGFRLVDMVNDDPYMAVLMLFLGSMLTVAGYPLIYLFEKLFNLLSASRLRELCDTNNDLLRDLEHKAPGTFQHSLQVMNMADAAARAIGANTLLVRAGALYHDIGKMKNPLCFIENESLAPAGKRFHSGLSPRESAVAIINHVADGLALADQYNLPGIVRDFILTHHGTSNTAYFYKQYIDSGGDPAAAEDFYYKGKKPSTKEQLILMVCDSVEAASRTLKDNSPETFSAFVESIVAGKMKAGQFDEADISIKQLNTVKQVLKNYLGQIYHERIVYPGERNGETEKTKQ